MKNVILSLFGFLISIGSVWFGFYGYEFFTAWMVAPTIVTAAMIFLLGIIICLAGFAEPD